MKKRIFRFAAGAAFVCASSGAFLLVAGCGGRTLLEESGGGGKGSGTSGTQGTTGAAAGAVTPIGTAGASAGNGVSGVLGGSGANGVAGSSAGVTAGVTTGGVSSGSVQGGGPGSFSGVTGVTGTSASGAYAGGSGFIGTGGSYDGNTGSTGSSGSYAGDTGATGSSADASGAVPYVAPPLPASAVVLDDMRSLESPTLGYWYTYSDRVVPFSEPVIIQSNLPGVINPSEGTSFYPTPNTDSRAPIIATQSVFQPWPFREVEGQGNDVFGAGFGLDLTDLRPSPDSSVVAAINACPSNPVSPLFNAMDPNALAPTGFDADAAGYTGIGFYAISFTGKALVVTVELDDPRTNGWGGTCDVCLNGGRCQGGTNGADCPCSDSFVESYLLGGTWGLYTFRFKDVGLRPENWSEQNLTPGGILSSALYNLHFQISSNGTVLPYYDFGVAYVFWLTD